MEDKTPHSMRPNYSHERQSGLGPIMGAHKNDFERNDEQLIWRIQVPGLTREDITLDVIDRTELRFTAPVDRNSRTFRDTMTVYLAPNDTIDYADLSLGVLTVTINRNLEIVQVDIESND